MNNIKYVGKEFLYYIYNYMVTYIPIFKIRKLYLIYILKIPIGYQSFIHMGCKIYSNLEIGSNSVIGRECHILGNVKIGSNVSITAQTYVFSSSHYKDSPDFEGFDTQIIIEDYVWIGARAMVLPGVKIQEGAILGAASTATKNIPPFEIHVGSPAKKVGDRSKNLSYNLKYAPYFQ